MAEQQTLDLREPMTARLEVRIQPSLKAVFMERCRANPTGPLDPADVVRRLMAQYVAEGRQPTLL
jgi:hypothetical protein